MTEIHRPAPLALIILDGFGHRENQEANAIYAAKKPYWDYLLAHYPHTLISGSGRCVGLPSGQMGNSEVGHLNMGAGRIVHQDFTRISEDIQTGAFFNNPVFTDAFSYAEKNHRAIHVFGLLSPGGVHSHESHIHALIQLGAKSTCPVYVHAFLDGRDVPPKSALTSLKTLDQLCEKAGNATIASLIGRYYAMDRDNRWERIEAAYDLLTSGIAFRDAPSAEEALQLAYAQGETDEFIKPTAVLNQQNEIVTIQEGDTVIFMNFRADRARELTETFTEPQFTGFPRKKWPHLHTFISLTDYDKRLNTTIAYPAESLNHIFAEIISQSGLKQLRIAETEKYAHVTFFFNGGIEAPFKGEDRVLIPSPKIATYDLKPEMSAFELTATLIQNIQLNKYDVIICNYANADMVGHSGDFHATVKAIEAIDANLSTLIPAILDAGGEAIITADHGNAEMMFDPTTGQPHTAHTADPVPFIYIGRKAEIALKNGKLSDIAPTMLYLLGMKTPLEMTGKPLVKLV